MAYRLHPNTSLAHEVVRIADHQLELALAALHDGNTERTSVLHAARRHVKKVRALLRLTRRAIGHRGYRAVNRRLRAANRLIEPLADGQAALDTLSRVAARYRDELPGDAVAAICHRLLRRDAMGREEAAVNDVAGTATALLRRERKRIRRLRMRDTGFHAIAGGLERTARQGQRAMAKALATGRSEDYHRWRLRVKDQWLQVRLLQRRCGNRLAGDERRLEELDGLLGECHNCAILREAVRTDSALARADAARCLRLVRRYERMLRRAANHLGARIYRETPASFVARVRRLWRITRRAKPVAGRTSWPSAA